MMQNCPWEVDRDRDGSGIALCPDIASRATRTQTSMKFHH